MNQVFHNHLGRLMTQHKRSFFDQREFEMTDFPLHTAESAPKEAQANLQAAEKKDGLSA